MGLPLTGDIASLGEGLKRAVIMAIDEANAAHATPQPIEALVFDDRSDPKEAVSIANRIISDPEVVAVVGHFNSGCSIPASRIYAQAGLPMISPASTNPELTLQQLSPQWAWPRCIFRVNTTDNVQGATAADFVSHDLKLKKIGIIHDKTAYGQGVAEEFKKQFEKDGGISVAFEGLQTGDRDFRSLLTRVKSSAPEALYFGGMFSESGILVRQARDVGFKGPFILPEANYDPSFLQVAGSAAEGTYVTFIGSPPELLDSAKKFVAAYKQRYPSDELKSYDHYGYEAASILISAIKAVGPDRKKIIDYLQHVKYDGVLGTTSFDEKGDTLNKTITLFQVRSENSSRWIENNLIGTFFEQLINGLTLGSIYALVALGYTLVYGVLLMINFAHSEIFMLGAFIGCAVLSATGGLPAPLPILLAFAGAMLLCGAGAMGIERIAYRPLAKCAAFGAAHLRDRRFHRLAERHVFNTQRFHRISAGIAVGAFSIRRISNVTDPNRDLWSAACR